MSATCIAEVMGSSLMRPELSFSQLGGNQFRYAWFVHEKLDWKLFEGQICCHSTELQAGREEDVNPEGAKTTIVTHMWWWQGLYTQLQRSCGR